MSRFFNASSKVPGLGRILSSPSSRMTHHSSSPSATTASRCGFQSHTILNRVDRALSLSAAMTLSPPSQSVYRQVAAWTADIPKTFPPPSGSSSSLSSSRSPDHRSDSDTQSSVVPPSEAARNEYEELIKIAVDILDTDPDHVFDKTIPPALVAEARAQVTRQIPRKPFPPSAPCAPRTSSPSAPVLLTRAEARAEMEEVVRIIIEILQITPDFDFPPFFPPHIVAHCKAEMASSTPTVAPTSCLPPPTHSSNVSESDCTSNWDTPSSSGFGGSEPNVVSTSNGSWVSATSDSSESVEIRSPCIQFSFDPSAPSPPPFSSVRCPTIPAVRKVVPQLSAPPPPTLLSNVSESDYTLNWDTPSSSGFGGSEPNVVSTSTVSFISATSDSSESVEIRSPCIQLSFEPSAPLPISFPPVRCHTVPYARKVIPPLSAACLPFLKKYAGQPGPRSRFCDVRIRKPIFPTPANVPAPFSSVPCPAVPSVRKVILPLFAARLPFLKKYAGQPGPRGRFCDVRIRKPFIPLAIICESPVITEEASTTNVTNFSKDRFDIPGSWVEDSDEILVSTKSSSWLSYLRPAAMLAVGASVAAFCLSKFF